MARRRRSRERRESAGRSAQESAARRQGGWALALMLALTFSTGVVDAVGYLGLDRVFTGNMTGNVVILGMAVAEPVAALVSGSGVAVAASSGADGGLPVIGPVVALVAFVLGAAGAGRVLRRSPATWTTRTSVLLLAVALVLTGLTVALAVLDVEAAATSAAASGAAPVDVGLLAVTGALGLVMGAQAATARRLAVKDVTTVVVTSTLTGLAADSRLAGGTSPVWRRRAGAVVLILLGAAAGAALLLWHLAAGVGLAAAITLVVVLLGHLSSRRTRRDARRAGAAA